MPGDVDVGYYLVVEAREGLGDLFPAPDEACWQSLPPDVRADLMSRCSGGGEVDWIWFQLECDELLRVLEYGPPEDDVLGSLPSAVGLEALGGFMRRCETSCTGDALANLRGRPEISSIMIGERLDRLWKLEVDRAIRVSHVRRPQLRRPPVRVRVLRRRWHCRARGSRGPPRRPGDDDEPSDVAVPEGHISEAQRPPVAPHSSPWPRRGNAIGAFT